MNIFVYSDESGVFDKIHNKIFVFGGAIFYQQMSVIIGTESILRLKNQFDRVKTSREKQKLRQVMCQINQKGNYIVH